MWFDQYVNLGDCWFNLICEMRNVADLVDFPCVCD